MGSLGRGAGRVHEHGGHHPGSTALDRISIAPPPTERWPQSVASWRLFLRLLLSRELLLRAPRGAAAARVPPGGRGGAGRGGRERGEGMAASPRSRPLSRHPSFGMLNFNVEWVGPAFFVFYGLLVGLSWGLLKLWLDTPLAWTYVHLLHSAVTFYLMHWRKGSPFGDDQGKYRRLTFWEQIDGGVQRTGNRKLLTAIPVVVYLLASKTSDYSEQPLLLNFGGVLVSVLAKLPEMHGVRVFGINKDP